MVDPGGDGRGGSRPPRGAAASELFGPNSWLVEDMYHRYLADPASVGESWRVLFAAERPAPGPQGALAPADRGGGPVPAIAAPVAPAPAAPAPSAAALAAPVAPAPAAPAPAPAIAAPVAPAPAAPAPSVPAAPPAVRATAGPAGPSPRGSAAPRGEGVEAVPLRGAAARVAGNMEASLHVPTATSVRTVPARLLEVNRALLNEELARAARPKVSFTHLIGYAVVQALVHVPALNASYVEDVDGRGTPGVVRHRHVGLGLAVDVARRDGSRGLLVPCVRDADTLSFRAFVAAYDDLVRKAHANQASPDDFAGTTVTLTNPGTLGTVQSVPRLMPGQGAIVGVGAVTLPAGFEAADPRVVAELGLGKVVTLTSTYDHRIIQGAESGLFLARVAELLTGGHGFYEQVFESMGVLSEPLRWSSDRHAGSRQTGDDQDRLVKQVHVQTLINMYRVRGHLIAHLDPLEAEPRDLPAELDPATYGLSVWDLPRRFFADGLAGRDMATLEEILRILRDAYCHTLGIEYMHIQHPEQKRWIQEHVEGVPPVIDGDEQRHVLDRLNAAEVFERFLHTRYVGQRRFGLEGAESTVVLLDALLDEAARAATAEVVIGMAHRGRLNVLANIVGKSYREIFEEFEGNLDPDSVQGSGDVKYHKGAVGKFVGRSGRALPVTMASNPSHLEAVDPVVEGMARAKQDRLWPPTDGTGTARPDPDAPFPVLSVLVHGDAAFAGQGVVAETLNLSGLSGYRIGGTVHVVINNQLGFTTAPEAARTSVYPTDVAKMVQAPVFHVNGDDPEACVRAARLAYGFRARFHKDVVIDLVCYRRHGHNEGDDPSYTQPLMYKRIEAHRSVRELYAETLVRRGDISPEEAEAALADFDSRLQAALDDVRATPPPPPPHLRGARPPRPVAAPVDTGVSEDVLRSLAVLTRSVPEGFVLHPKLERQFAQRDAMVARGEVDWSLAEALAFGSLLVEGVDVRLTGQDSRRGTFSQRHAVLVDYATGREFVPLSHLDELRSQLRDQPAGAAGTPAAPSGPRTGHFTVRDSLLSEYASLGFEYGYAVEAPDALVAWEAQFGDFVNGAEIILDNFVVAAEDKWGQHAGLVLLLPHGYEGQGPEHSSARIERFLSLCARGNLYVAQPSTAAQYFHLLRAQAYRNPKVPLVAFTPKSMLRAQASRSKLEELTAGTFRAVLDDPAVPDPSAVRRVVLCSGKIAHEAMQRRDRLRAGEVVEPVTPRPADVRPLAPDALAVVRVEQLYPWPEQAIEGVLAGYPAAAEVVWLQEEPENMGAWSFVHARLHRTLRDRYELGHVSRDESASPATGSAALHRVEQADLLDRAIG
ncbi:MAG TPA: multifunctional oxoglutarate decarboxylase/oxoglutarate dehydrogenase thiamine pyrophosphate-binding subunit/dihydrolipoyllysine-residue succinyltransferase subunit [Acidimicrobiales bacterium]|nr:multifunctional oxoglutarate decarboxylase/oxoglutarate dehydrogenase thiamine pyrophosphate-binding subunit/dihydrolipoyllysine-residue succinyltransferase subunit [Acidimicrobiales bacterium]